jgi:hypothetical protein
MLSDGDDVMRGDMRGALAADCWSCDTGVPAPLAEEDAAALLEAMGVAPRLPLRMRRMVMSVSCGRGAGGRGEGERKGVVSYCPV